MIPKQQIYDRLMGCLYGQAIGDALGLGAEGQYADSMAKIYPNKLQRYDEIIPFAHVRYWRPAEFTDDTDQMLCILNALMSDYCINPITIAKNIRYWYETDGIGCGALTYNVINAPEWIEKPIEKSQAVWELTDKQSAPNGGLMRTSVVGLWNENVIENAEVACKVTHYDPRCVGSCVIASEIINNLVWHNREMSYVEIIEIANCYDNRIAEWVTLAKESCNIRALELDEEKSMGYTLRTLAAALWTYWHSKDFTSGLIDVVNEGGDADTNASIACAILGAKYGFSTIPSHYIEKMYKTDEYRTICEQFTNLCLSKFHNNNELI